MADLATLGRLAEMVARHRMEEAGQMVGVAYRVLSEIPELAGKAGNGFVSSAEALAREAMTLQQRIEKEVREHFRPKVDATQTVDVAKLEEILGARRRMATDAQADTEIVPA